MSTEHVLKHFEKMGARVKVRGPGRSPVESEPKFFGIDVLRDRNGEYFEIVRAEDGPEMETLQILPGDRHLLLYTRDGQRFLCGHDERHWFVAAVEGRVSTVGDAKRSLLPREIRGVMAGVSSDVIDRRRNPLFKRQGEWFFLPVRDQGKVPDDVVFRNEPIQRSTESKPHICEKLCRRGSKTVYILGREVMEEEVFLARRRGDPNFSHRVVPRQVAAEIFVRGYVRHPDHTTVWLAEWHRLYLNGEVTTQAIRFFD